MERRNSLTRRAAGQPVTGREEDVVDGGSEVEPHASMTVVAEKSTKRLPGQHHEAESVRGVG